MNSFESQKSDQPSVLPNPYSRHTTFNLNTKLLKNARIIIANYDLIKKDFDLTDMSDSDIDDYLLNNFCLMSEENVRYWSNVLETEPIVDRNINSNNVFRPMNYGRSLVYSLSYIIDTNKKIEIDQLYRRVIKLQAYLRKDKDNKDIQNEIEEISQSIESLENKYYDELKSKQIKLIDIKGSGLSDHFAYISDNHIKRKQNLIPTTKSHSNGLFPLKDAIYEYIMEGLIHTICQKSKLFQHLKVGTIRSYAVIDLGIKLKGQEDNASLYLRQAHHRTTNNIGMIKSESALLLQMELGLFGINTHQSGLLIKDTIDVQVTHELGDIDWHAFDTNEPNNPNNKNISIHLFDFGHYTIFGNTYYPLIIGIIQTHLNLAIKNDDIKVNMLAELSIILQDTQFIKEFWNKYDLLDIIGLKDEVYSYLKEYSDNELLEKVGIFWKQKGYQKLKMGRIDILTQDDLVIDIGLAGMVPYVSQDRVLTSSKIKEIIQSFNNNIDKVYDVNNCYKENYVRLLEIYQRIHDLIIKYYSHVNKYYVKKLIGK